MSTLFEATELLGIPMRSRTVRSATWDGMASPEGFVTEKMLGFCQSQARGGVALFITGLALVDRTGQAGPGQLSVCEDACIEGLARLAETIHREGASCAMQLAHAGVRAVSSLTGSAPAGPSALKDIKESRALAKEEMENLVNAYALAAQRARQAGFDAVQLHCAHGYLLSQFLSPRYNQRTDEYGGSVSGRARFPCEIASRLRADLGDAYPVLAKINVSDYAENGLEPADALETARLLCKAGVSALELSGGLPESGPKRICMRTGLPKGPEDEAYYKGISKTFRDALHVPIILTGGVRSYEVCQRLLADGECDYIGLSRPLICEPDLIRHWERGDFIRSSCRSCNSCRKNGADGGIACVLQEKQTEE